LATCFESFDPSFHVFPSCYKSNPTGTKGTMVDFSESVPTSPVFGAHRLMFCHVWSIGRETPLDGGSHNKINENESFGLLSNGLT
jgi:hypothetical protein